MREALLHNPGSRESSIARGGNKTKRTRDSPVENRRIQLQGRKPRTLNARIAFYGRYTEDSVNQLFERMTNWVRSLKINKATLAIVAAFVLVIGIMPVTASINPVGDQQDVFNSGVATCTLSDGTVIPRPDSGKCPENHLPTCELPDGTVVVGECPPDPEPPTNGDGFKPANCEGELRFEEGLARGFAGPTTQEMMEALNIRVGNQRSYHDELVRVGESCALWHTGVGAGGAFSANLRNEVAGFRNFLYQVGIVGEDFQRIMSDSDGKRIRNIRQLTIYWVGDPEGEHTYPFGIWLYNCDDALRESNSWGSADVDDPSFRYVLDNCGGSIPTDNIVNRSSPDGDPGAKPGNGGGDGSLASLQCNTENAAASWINQNKTGNGQVKADDLRHPPAPGDRVYEHGWYWPASASHPALEFDVDSLGWFRIDFDGGSIESGSTPRVKGATFWCHS